MQFNNYCEMDNIVSICAIEHLFDTLRYINVVFIIILI